MWGRQIELTDINLSRLTAQALIACAQVAVLLLAYTGQSPA